MIRSMTERDLDAVVYVEYSVTDFPWPRTQFIDSLNAGHRCQVLETDYGIAGFTIVSTVVDEATLLNIAVAPQCQGEGLGRVLLKDCLDAIAQQQVTQCFLEVRSSNRRAINLYQSAGFVSVGERRKYYPAASGREDAIVMRWQVEKTSNECS